MRAPKHLNALRAFEATARLGSFKAAADEIGVTPEAFRRLSNVTDRLKGLSKSGSLTISTSPSITSKWLVPLFPKFLHDESDIDVRLDITNRLLDLTTGEFDIVIRYAKKAEDWSNLNVISLAQDEKLLAVC